MGDEKPKRGVLVELSEAELGLAALGVLMLRDGVPSIHRDAQALYEKLKDASVDAMVAKGPGK